MYTFDGHVSEFSSDQNYNGRTHCSTNSRQFSVTSLLRLGHKRRHSGSDPDLDSAEGELLPLLLFFIIIEFLIVWGTGSLIWFECQGWEYSGHGCHLLLSVSKIWKRILLILIYKMKHFNTNSILTFYMFCNYLRRIKYFLTEWRNDYFDRDFDISR